jgi:uncharacterized LabA/DUF88 family protein
MAEKRAMVFVDAQNLYHSAREYYGGESDLDLQELPKVLANDYDIIRSYYFDSYEQDKYKRNFDTMLNRKGYRVVAKKLVERDGNTQEKGVDISLATELIAQGFNDSYDVAILVSGDDFRRAMEYVQNQGKIVIGAMFQSTAAGKFMDTVDEFINLEDIAQKLKRD